MSERLLEIRDLTVVYETEEETVRAVNEISLDLAFGETLGLVGETGAGKTTTALSILRLLPDRVGHITKGRILFDGVDITAATEAEMRSIRGNAISMIFQDPMTSLNPVHTVGEQIEEVLALHRTRESKQRIAERVDEILRLVGLPPDRKRDFPHQFSGGMKQRVLIAMALACKPKLLLADEPTTALDVTIQAQVLDLMQRLKNVFKTSLLFITHDLGIVAQTCDRVAIMYAGEIVELGTVRDLFEGRRHHPYTAGLFGSIPNLEKSSRRLQAIEGLMPDPTNLPRGCKFHPRCSRRMPVCERMQPGVAAEGTHSIRCHLFTSDAAATERGEVA